MSAVQRCSWLPVDTLATVILEIAEVKTSSSSSPQQLKSHYDTGVYNLVNPHTFSWEDLLDVLHANGLHFSTKPFADWLSLLKASASKCEEDDNPAVKLLEYFETSYSADEGNLVSEGIRFETSAAEKDSRALREAPRCVESGLVGKFVERWSKKWGGVGGGRDVKVNGYHSAGQSVAVRNGTGSEFNKT